jgi:hypothetical protein
LEDVQEDGEVFAGEGGERENVVGGRREGKEQGGRGCE